MKRSAGIAVGSAILAGTASGKRTPDGVDTDFDPHSFPQVDRFVKSVFDADANPLQQLVEWSETDEMDAVFSALTRPQVEAFFDAVLPKYVAREQVQLTHRDGAPRRGADVSPDAILAQEQGTVLQSHETGVEAIDDDPAETWGWNERDVHRRSDESIEASLVESGTTNDQTRVGTTSHPSYRYSTSYSDTISAYAASFDYTGYEWRGRIYWDWYRGGSSGVTDIDAVDTVLYTNWAVSHEGTEIDIVDRGEYFDAYLQATFDNRMGEICIDYVRGVYCVDLRQTFQPYLELRGEENGSGSTLDSGNDSLFP
ncbi:hypothetical protein OB905_04375 [Halobacteria archaeon AArc-dxtr1]|nr:hypothetical protein [Halobacteria archaeon AArc-dxtr1]